MAKRKTTTNVTDKVAVNEEKVNEVTEVTEPTVDVVEEIQQEEVAGETASDEAEEQVEEETKAEQEQPEVVVAEAEVTKTTEPTKVTGQTDPFLNSYYKRRIF